MSETLHVRIATRDDAKNIAAFNVRFAKETSNKNIPMQVTEQGVHNVFSKFHNGFYLVAEIEHKIVGITMITREWSDWSNAAYYCIQGIFVNHDEEDNIHDALFNKAKDLAKEHHDVCGLRLYVHANETKTIKRYNELGLQTSPFKVLEENFQ